MSFLKMYSLSIFALLLWSFAFHYKVEDSKKTVFDNNYDPFESKMVFVKGGTFTMGSNLESDYEKPAHDVTLNDFHISKTEVTQKEWKTIMGDNPSFHTECDECPVEAINWNGIQEFISILNQKTGKKYRLPTEAEWEYAALGGKYSKGFVFAGSNNIYEVCWYKDNAKGASHKVAEKSPNELGLYDMSGNVAEWCQDWGSQTYYSESPLKDPKGPSAGTYKIVRGGSFEDYPVIALVKRRIGSDLKMKAISQGLRLAL